MIHLLLAAAAFAGPDLGAALELDLVGPIAVGPRVEATWGLSPGDGGQRLLAAAGVIPTPEYVYLPFTVGWRSTGPVDRQLAPVVGLGMQAQLFVLTDMPVQARHAWAAELGARGSVSDAVDVSLVVGPELITFGVPGIGLAVRLGVTEGR